MENVIKALLIAAAIFITILILSLLVMVYNQISSYYETQHEFNVIEQAQKFNARFENFHREDVRGSDLISLMNRVIDYNASEVYHDGSGDYGRILVTIKLGKDEILGQFKYEIDDSTLKNKYLREIITNSNKSGDNWKDDNELVDITNTSVDLCGELGDIGVLNPTDTQLQHLASNISNIMVDEKEDWAESYRFKRAELLKDILDIDIKIDDKTGKTKTESEDKITKIKNIASQYYQYMQFKRALFNCTEVEYDKNTNRIIKMNFELQIDDSGKVEFN